MTHAQSSFDLFGLQFNTSKMVIVKNKTLFRYLIDFIVEPKSLESDKLFLDNSLDSPSLSKMCVDWYELVKLCVKIDFL